MTSQLNVDTIVDKAGSGGTNIKVGNTSTYVSDGGGVVQNAVSGLAKMFVRANSSAVSNDVESFNVSSALDLSTDGNYDHSFTNPMVTTVYSVTVSAQTASAKMGGYSNLRTTTIEVNIYTSGGAASNSGHSIQIFGDLA